MVDTTATFMPCLRHAATDLRDSAVRTIGVLMSLLVL